jgi:hypothetical protein
MRSTRRAVHRSDANASPMLTLARKLGLTVEVIGRPVDWLVWDGFSWNVVEIKSNRGTYTDDQKTFLCNCAARNAPVLTWRSEQQIIEYCNTIRQALR